MCGIFFSIGFESLPAAVIDSVAHRGPDGRGWDEFTCRYGSVVMAHRRLAILDLSENGHQPMSAADGRYWVTYNGEIYNYLEVRKELEHLGASFTTKTDTEVLLKAYLKWGPGCLERFNGMFSFVIWDDKEKRVFAARDRFGVKPLYYYRQGNKIAFASEIKQFKYTANWRPSLQKEMAEEYLEKGYCDHKHETLYKDVFQILPGHYLTLDESFTPKITQWYDLKSRVKNIRISKENAVTEFRALFKDAISLRLRSDVPVGACLSGGIDSSSIVSMLRELLPTQLINTFSAVFPGYSVDESSYIDELAIQKKLLSYKNYPSVEDFIESIDNILHHQDLPFAGTSVFAQWSTFNSAKAQGIIVLLDGQGADESLLGYPWMLNSVIFDYAKRFKFIELYNFFKWQSQYKGQSAKMTLLVGLRERYPSFYAFLLKLKKCAVPQKQEAFDSLFHVCLNHFSHNLQTLLRYEDRNSMAFSRESRLPFLDYRLVEFILSLSVSYRFRDTTTKWVLREALKDINLPSILTRKDKIGFATPEQEWLNVLKNKVGNIDFKTFIFDRWVKNENMIVN